MAGTAYYAYAPTQRFEPFADVASADARKATLQREHPNVVFFVGQFYTFEVGEAVLFRKRGSHRFGERGVVQSITDDGLYVIRWGYGPDEAIAPNFLEPERA